MSATEFSTELRELRNDAGLMTKVGTDLYAAPEHYSLTGVPGSQLSPAADVYGLAKTLFFILCGRPPDEFRQKQITYLPAHINAESWSEDVLRVLSTATHEQAALRYQSAEEFYLALQAIADLTQHSARSHPKACNPKHPHLRIVVDVPSDQRNSRVRTVGERWGSFKSRADALDARISPALQHFRLSLTNLWRNFVCYMRTLPLRLLLRIAIVLILCLTMLVALPPLVRRWHPATSAPATKQAEAKTPAEKLAVAVTDLNLRSAPGKTSLKVGLVEKGSKVRILRYNSARDWCEVEVMQHGRSKEDPSSADRGWVYARALR